MNDNATTAGEDLLYEVRDGVARITFNRPQARNALTFAMYERMAQICEAADADKSIKAVIVSGAGGKAFASGTDISQFRAFKTAQDGLDYEGRIDRVLGTLESCRVPTIAAIDGFCTGGGLGIAMCCDLRIATKPSKFGIPIARTLGNMLSTANLSRLAGAEESHRIGLVTEVVEDGAALTARADEVAALISGHAPLTLQAVKEGLRRLQPRLSREEGEDLITLCYTSNDFREGMEAFLNKRQPKWTGT